MIDNCGFFSKLFSSVKKAVSTTVGKVITGAAVVAAVAVGAACAAITAPLVVTVGLAVGLGAAVGAIGLGAASAVSSLIIDGYIDWDAVGDCALVGGVVGGFLGALGFSATKAIQAINALKAAPKFGTQFDKLGTYVKNPGVKVDWNLTTKHATERMAERGMSQSAVNNIVKNGFTLSQNGGKYLIFSKEGAAVVSEGGKLITTWGFENFDEAMLALLKLLGGL